MATEMIHLLAAGKWAAGVPGFDASPEFFLGAISPDAVHARGHVEKAEKLRAHLENHGTLRAEPLAEYIAERRTPFDIGYVVHLLCDPFWCAKYRRELPGLFDESGHTIPRMYYADCARAESMLCDERALDMLEAAAVPDDNPLVSADEISKWRDIVVAQYRAPANPGETYGFITREFVLEYVSEVVDYINDMLRRLNYEPCTASDNGAQEHPRL